MNKKSEKTWHIYHIPFSKIARKIFKITKDIYTKLQRMYLNVFKAELMCSLKRNKKMGDYLVSAKLK